jgi:hypothetical protein
VSQFLGIQYATLKNRLADAELVERRHGDILDATKDGYARIPLRQTTRCSLIWNLR